MELTRDFHPEIIAYGLQYLSYLITEEDFKEFIPHLKVGITFSKKIGYRESQESVGNVLFIASLRGYSGAESLLSEAFEKNDHAKKGALSVAAKHLLFPDIGEKCREIYIRFLNEEPKTLGRVYDRFFAEFQNKDFKELYPLISAYSKSKAASYADHFFYEYLFKCCGKEPELCIDLLSNFKEMQKPDIRFNEVRDDQVRLLINAYNRLKEWGTSNSSYLEKAMDIFDEILGSQDYRGYAMQVMKEVDY